MNIHKCFFMTLMVIVVCSEAFFQNTHVKHLKTKKFLGVIHTYTYTYTHIHIQICLHMYIHICLRTCRKLIDRIKTHLGDASSYQSGWLLSIYTIYLIYYTIYYIFIHNILNCVLYDIHKILNCILYLIQLQVG